MLFYGKNLAQFVFMFETQSFARQKFLMREPRYFNGYHENLFPGHESKIGDHEDMMGGYEDITSNHENISGVLWEILRVVTRL
jgi:hypothetical protein